MKNGVNVERDVNNLSSDGMRWGERLMTEVVGDCLCVTIYGAEGEEL